MPTYPNTRRVIGLAPDQPSYRLLIVDDQVEIRLLLWKLLSSTGFDVCEARSGEEGLAIWAMWKPHLVLLDINMPGMDGYTVARRIKAAPEGKATSIIAVTATNDESAIFAAGCDDFIRKPFQSQFLLSEIAKHLGVRYLYQ
jgi:CheY-like chemotaxis protein